MRIRLILLLLFVLALAAGTVSAQDEAATEPESLSVPIILGCEMGSGCIQWETAGQVTAETIYATLGEDPYGHNTVVVTDGGDLQWSAVNPEGLNLNYGGDDDFTVTEPVDFDFTDEDFADEEDPVDLQDVLDFPAGTRVVPAEGIWEGINYASEMVCPGMTFDVPESPLQIGEVVVSEDGDTYSGTGLGEGEGTVDLVRRHPQDNLFVGELEFSDPDGGVVTLEYEVMFTTPWIAFGLITGELSGGGMTCDIERTFWAAHQDLDFFQPIPVEEPDEGDEEGESSDGDSEETSDE